MLRHRLKQVIVIYHAHPYNVSVPILKFGEDRSNTF